MTTETLPAGRLLAVADYKSDIKPTWCPGCGDFGVLSATYKALSELQLDRLDTVVVSGIGCSSRIPYFLRTFGIHTVHGRALPVAQGVKLANPELTVIAFGGDGDLFSIGAGHFPHAVNRNMNITVVMMDNQTYGLTKGQTSPTSPVGRKTKSTPHGSIAQPMNPVLQALAMGATFVARAYSAKPALLTQVMVEAVRHRGFSFIQVESPCTEYNNTFNYFDALVQELPDDWDRADLDRAMSLALNEDKVNIGVFYQREGRETYEDQYGAFVPDKITFDTRTHLAQFA